MKVLLVEDDPTNEFIANRLFKKDFDIENAHNSSEALEMVEKTVYDVIITDIKLGSSSLGGVELMKEIRKSSSNADTKIVAVSSYSTLEEAGIYQHEGFDLFLSKPYSRENMLQSILKLVSA